jgi:ketosteroid isomerase-like protein
LSPSPPGLEVLAGQVREALEHADLDGYRELLDPGVTWGAPDDPQPSCRTRDQVLAWYRRGRARGVRARVTETEVGVDRILVGLEVELESGDDAPTRRWQVLTVRNGRIVDIRGFEDRETAAARMG